MATVTVVSTWYETETLTQLPTSTTVQSLTETDTLTYVAGRWIPLDRLD